MNNRDIARNHNTSEIWARYRKLERKSVFGLSGKAPCTQSRMITSSFSILGLLIFSFSFVGVYLLYLGLHPWNKFTLQSNVTSYCIHLCPVFFVRQWKGVLRFVHIADHATTRDQYLPDYHSQEHCCDIGRLSHQMSCIVFMTCSGVVYRVFKHPLEHIKPSFKWWFF